VKKQTHKQVEQSLLSQLTENVFGDNSGQDVQNIQMWTHCYVQNMYYSATIITFAL